MTEPASYIYDTYSFIHSLPKEQLLQVGNIEIEGSPIPSFDEELLINVCEDVTKVFEKEENNIEIDGDVIVVGDIHGSFLDLLRILKYIDTCDAKVIFLGDYVDRGYFSLECITLLFSLKILRPSTYYLLRGNHEFDAMCSHYGFKNEILNYHNPQKSDQNVNDNSTNQINDEINFNLDDNEKDKTHLNDDSYFANHININCYKYSEKLYNAFIKAFSFMPISAIVNKTSFCIHGGLTPLLSKVENITKQIQRPISEFDENLLLSDILWGDPSSRQSQNYSDNQRGRGKLFNGPVVVNFLKNNNLKRLIRGHECVNNGIEFLFNKKCITVFSASSYSCEMGNSSGILKLYKEEDIIEPVIFPPIHRLKKWNANYYKVQPFAQRFRNPANRKGFLFSFAHISGAKSEHNVISQFHTLRSSSRGNFHDDDADKGKSNSGRVLNQTNGRRKSKFHCLLPPVSSVSKQKNYALNSPQILMPKVSKHNSEFTLNKCEYCD